MGNSKIVDFIASYIEKFYNEDKPTIIKNYSALREDYIPKEILFRGEQLERIARFIFASVRGSVTSTLNIFGPTGTGKTVSVRYLQSQFVNLSITKKLPFRFLYINIKPYSIGSPLYSFVKYLVAKLTQIPPKDGAKYTDLIDVLMNYLSSTKKKIILAVDEIDSLFKEDPNDILYTLLRSGKITLITISNTRSFLDKLDARVYSSMTPQSLVFESYNAKQLTEILLDRAREAFYPDTYDPAAISFLAAHVARDNGDARRAILLLKNAAELAQTMGDKKLEIDHVKEAIDSYESDYFIKEIEVLTIQQKLVALSLLITALNNDDTIIDASEAYNRYVKLCSDFGERPQSRSAFFRKIRELEIYLDGMIEGSVIYRGRKGKQKIISINIDKQKIQNIVERLLS